MKGAKRKVTIRSVSTKFKFPDNPDKGKHAIGPGLLTTQNLTGGKKGTTESTQPFSSQVQKKKNTNSYPHAEETAGLKLYTK